MTGFQLVLFVNAAYSVVRSLVEPSSIERWSRSFTSPPLENDFPSPERMATSASSSPSRRWSASTRLAMSSSRSALCFSGRLNEMNAMRSRTSYSTVMRRSVRVGLRGVRRPTQLLLDGRPTLELPHHRAPIDEQLVDVH